jgi:hypothetical protein
MIVRLCSVTLHNDRKIVYALRCNTEVRHMALHYVPAVALTYIDLHEVFEVDLGRLGKERNEGR